MSNEITPAYWIQEKYFVYMFTTFVEYNMSHSQRKLKDNLSIDKFIDVFVNFIIHDRFYFRCLISLLFDFSDN